ncbi:MAG: acyl-CoA dehydrogenase family protein, partial [Elusimicrobiota bacterium]
MDFDLNDEQKTVQEAARAFAEKRLKPLAQKFDEEEEIPLELYREAGALGFFGLFVPEEYGGLGLDPVGVVCVMEELARACAAFQICLTVHNSLAVGALLKAGTKEQKDRYLPDLASGRKIGAYSLSEPGAGTDAGSLKAAAKPEGDSFLLNGTKSWVSSAGFADLFVVFVSTDPSKGSRGISCLLVDKGTPGLQIGKKERKMGMRGSDTREIHFKDCR